MPVSASPRVSVPALGGRWCQRSSPNYADSGISEAFHARVEIAMLTFFEVSVDELVEALPFDYSQLFPDVRDHFSAEHRLRARKRMLHHCVYGS